MVHLILFAVSWVSIFCFGRAVSVPDEEHGSRSWTTWGGDTSDMAAARGRSLVKVGLWGLRLTLMVGPILPSPVVEQAAPAKGPASATCEASLGLLGAQPDSDLRILD